MNAVNPKDLRLLEIVGKTAGVSQRELANYSGFSLGMVNLIVQRLAHTGYIKIAHLNRRKAGYFLTPKGISAISIRSYSYLIRTIRVYETYRKQVDSIIESLIRNGTQSFMIYGVGDLADLVRVVLEQRGTTIRFRLAHEGSPLKVRPGEVVLNCLAEGDRPVEGISILEALLPHAPPTQDFITFEEASHELV